MVVGGRPSKRRSHSDSDRRRKTVKLIHSVVIATSMTAARCEENAHDLTKPIREKHNAQNLVARSLGVLNGWAAFWMAACS